MAISYPVNLPTTINPQSFDMRLIRATGMTQSPFSFNQQVYQHPGAMWQAEMRFPPMSRSEVAAFQAFLISLRGRRGTFLMGDPIGSTIRGTATGLQFDGAQTLRSTEVDVKNMGDTKTILAGDLIQVGTGSDARLHMVVADATSNASGEATIDIEPGLRKNVSDSESISIADTVGVWRLSADDVGWSIDLASQYGITIPCMEAL